MKKPVITGLLIIWTAYSTVQALSFTVQPSLSKDGSGKWWVEFGLNQAADVAVSIVSAQDSSVIRHLAAGLLGPNAPAPFLKDSLHQRVEWDGTDDAGNTAATPESLSVRVRAGVGVRLANIVGDNMYVFNQTCGGIVPGPGGTLYILGNAGYPGLPGNPKGNYYLRQYDASGNYLRTVFPPAAGLPIDSVTGYGINVLPGGGWAPKTTCIYAPGLTNSLCANMATQLLPLGRPGELVLVNGMDMQTMSESGALASAVTQKIITSPAAPDPATYRCMGPHYWTASHDPGTLYLSGWYYGTVDLGSWLVDALDTGFWADGQVFKVDRATGVVSPFIRLDSVPVSSEDRMDQLGGGANATSAIHGVAVDDSGRVFVCDRLHQRISVYDTTGTLVGAVPCENPDYVAVSRRTGVLYVITRRDVWNAGPMNLVKFNGWRTPAPASATTLLTTSITTSRGAPCMALTENGNSTIAWVGYSTFGIRQYRDDGALFTLLRDFSQAAGNLVFDRIAVDPVTQRTYVTDGSYTMWKIEDWSDPVFTTCSTSAGQQLYGCEPAIGPNGFLYVRTAPRQPFSAFVGPILRYTQDHLHAPAPYANTGTNLATGFLLLRAGSGLSDKGIAVNRQGQIGLISQLTDSDNNWMFFMSPDTGCTDSSFKGIPTVTAIGGKCGGVKFDRDGNAYVGLNVTPPDRMVLPGFETDWAFNFSGSVVKYNHGSTGSVSSGQAIGASKVYPQALGGLSADGLSVCVCRSPRFDLDPYGRLFIPNGPASRVAVADNAGNTLLSFGQYGNTDSRGGLSGPGQVLAEPAIPLAWPIAVAATEDYIHVNDWVNARHVRLQMTYELDNMDGLTAPNRSESKSLSAWQTLDFFSAPNPFNPQSALRVSMPAAGHLRLAVYRADGRLVRVISEGRFGAGAHGFTWNGTDRTGKPVTAGVYLYRLTAGNRSITKKTVLSR